MGLLQDVAAANRGFDRCKFGVWFAQQDSKYQAEILEVLESDFKTNTIWRVLSKKHQPFMSSSVFVRHREGRCACVSS